MVLSNHSSVCFLTKAFWVLPFLFFLLLKSLCGAQVGKVSRHTCIAYFAKSINGSMEKNIIQSNQDVQVCGYIEAILILLCSLKHISLFIETLKKPFVRTWTIFYSLLSFLPSPFFFMSHFFFSSLMSLFTIKLLRERSYKFGAFILIEPNQDIFVHSQCRSRTFFLVDPKWNVSLAPTPSVWVVQMFGGVYVILVLKAW